MMNGNVLNVVISMILGIMSNQLTMIVFLFVALHAAEIILIVRIVVLCLTTKYPFLL